MTVFGEERDWKNYPELTNAELDTELLVSPHFQFTTDFEAVVVRVHDGDTVTLRSDERDFDFPLRLASIDAPELGTGVSGEEARDFLAGQVLGERVFVKLSKERVEKWGRLLGDVFVGGVNVGESMVQLGFAFPFARRREGELVSFDVILKGAGWV